MIRFRVRIGARSLTQDQYHIPITPGGYETKYNNRPKLYFIVWDESLMSQLILIERILVNLNEAKWPSGLRRQFQVLVFGRGFEPHLCQAKDLRLNHCSGAERIEN